MVPHLLSTLSSNGRGRGYRNAPLSRGQAPTYWNGTGTVSTTITAMDDVEYGHPGDADKILTIVPGMDTHGREKLMVRESKTTQELTEIKEPVVSSENRTTASSSS